MKRMAILLLACTLLTGCSSQKAQSSAPEPTTEAMTAAEGTTEHETEPETTSEVPETESLGRLSYREVLESFFYDSELPGIGAVEKMKWTDETYDLFAVRDVDGDGSDELIIRNRDASVANQIGVVYGHNDDGELVLELLTHENMSFYRSGCVKVFSGSGFWPYNLYQYSGGVYEWTAFVEAFYKKEVERRDREAEENGIEPQYSYPRESTNRGEDFVYYITTDPEYFKNSDYEKLGPIDVTEYEDWYDGYTGGETAWILKYFPLTEENIRKVEGNSAPFEPMINIDAGEPDDTYFMNQRRGFFPAEDGGYYYYAYKGGWDSAHYVLAYDGGDGNYTFLENADRFYPSYYRDGTFWGSVLDQDNVYHRLCSYRDGEYAFPDPDKLRSPYFTADSIYAIDDAVSTYRTVFYRMEYGSDKAEIAAELDFPNLTYAVYGNRLFWAYSDSYAGVTKEAQRRFSVIDLETGENTELDDGGVGFVCGDYMYYTDGWSSDDFSICRMSLDDYSVEKIYEGGMLAAVHDGYLIYRVPGGSDSFGVIYRLGKGENVKLFDPNEMFGDSYYYSVDTVQSEGGHLYIELSSGPYYSNIMEIDINGNFIKQIYFHSGT